MHALTHGFASLLKARRCVRRSVLPCGKNQFRLMFSRHRFFSLASQLTLAPSGLSASTRSCALPWHARNGRSALHLLRAAALLEPMLHTALAMCTCQELRQRNLVGPHVFAESADATTSILAPDVLATSWAKARHAGAALRPSMAAMPSMTKAKPPKAERQTRDATTLFATRSFAPGSRRPLRSGNDSSVLPLPMLPSKRIECVHVCRHKL